MQLNLRRVLIALIALVAIGGIWSALFAGSAAPQATDLSGANTVSGTLVIDFGKLSDRVVETYDYELDADAKSWDIFAAVGIDVAGTGNFPTGFVCRLQGWPAESEQDCLDVPKYSEGSWAYFVTNPEIGPGWFMSGVGAATHTPVCGGYEAWVWIAPGESASATVPDFEPTLRGCA